MCLHIVSNSPVEQRAVAAAVASCGHQLTMHLLNGNVLVPGAHWSVNFTKSINKTVDYSWLGYVLWENRKHFRAKEYHSKQWNR